MNDAVDLPRVEAIVVGASAGGVEALLTLLAPLRQGYVLPIIVVLHLPEERRSQLAEVFARRLMLPVEEATDKRDHGPDKGEASYWSVTVGDRVAPNAVWSYRDPLSGRDDIKGYLAFYWHRMEAWFEEGEEVFDPAMVPFAATYADQHERDSKALQGAVASGCRSAQAGC